MKFYRNPDMKSLWVASGDVIATSGLLLLADEESELVQGFGSAGNS